MNSHICPRIIEAITSHFAKGFRVSQFGEECFVVTPFLSSDSSPIEFFVYRSNNGFRLTDEGEALNQLFVSGVVVNGNKELENQVRVIALQNNVEFENSELFVLTNFDDLGTAVQSLTTTIQSVSYLVYKRVHRLRIKFEDEVEKLLTTNRVNYEHKYSIRGHASTHVVPFFVNSRKNILIQPVTATTVRSARNKAKAIAYQWLDLQKLHDEQLKYNVVVDNRTDDQESIWADQDARSPLFSYSTSVFFWKEDRDELVSVLIG